MVVTPAGKNLGKAFAAGRVVPVGDAFAVAPWNAEAPVTYISAASGKAIATLDLGTGTFADMVTLPIDSTTLARLGGP